LLGDSTFAFGTTLPCPKDWEFLFMAAGLSPCPPVLNYISYRELARTLKGALPNESISFLCASALLHPATI
jgi:hypothetical protein